MILKPTTILAGTFFVSFSAYSQFTQAFDVAKQLNPAMAGLEYQINANLFTTGGRLSYGRTFGVMGNYSGFNSKHKIGYGINTVNNIFSWNDNFFSNQNLTKLSLNKQYSLNNKLQLSTGLGLGYNSRQTGYFEGSSINTKINNENSLQVELGAVLKSERLQIGLSGGYQFALRENNPYLNQLILNISAAYTFGKADGLQFTPHVLLSQLGPNIGGTFKYKSKYMLGGGLAGNNFIGGPTPYITAGYTIRDKFSINYTYNFRRNYGFPVSKHALTLSLKLGKK